MNTPGWWASCACKVEVPHFIAPMMRKSGSAMSLLRGPVRAQRLQRVGPDIARLRLDRGGHGAPGQAAQLRDGPARGPHEIGQDRPHRAMRLPEEPGARA